MIPAPAHPPVVGHAAPALDVEYVISLYDRYAEDLKRVRTSQLALYRQHVRHPSLCGAIHHSSLGVLDVGGMVASHYLASRGGRPWLGPGLDDIEAEISYLMIRDRRPQVVVEMSPSGGWSTTWILHALRDNGSGTLHSFDVVDHARWNVPPELAGARWRFRQGDVKVEMDVAPEEIDYLFIDCDHSSEFARWYLGSLLPKLRRGTAVSIHDIFHSPFVLWCWELVGLKMGESTVVKEWLRTNGVPHFSASPKSSEASHAQLQRKRRALGMFEPVHYATANSMVYLRT